MQSSTEESALGIHVLYYVNTMPLAIPAWSRVANPLTDQQPKRRHKRLLKLGSSNHLLGIEIENHGVPACLLSHFSHGWLFEPLWTVYSPQDSSVHRIFQARILEWVAMPSSGDLPDARMESVFPVAPALQILYHWASGEAPRTMGRINLLITRGEVDKKGRMKLQGTGDRKWEVMRNQKVWPG